MIIQEYSSVRKEWICKSKTQPLVVVGSRKLKIVLGTMINKRTKNKPKKQVFWSKLARQPKHIREVISQMLSLSEFKRFEPPDLSCFMSKVLQKK